MLRGSAGMNSGKSLLMGDKWFHFAALWLGQVGLPSCFERSFFSITAVRFGAPRWYLRKVMYKFIVVRAMCRGTPLCVPLRWFPRYGHVFCLALPRFPALVCGNLVTMSRFRMHVTSGIMISNRSWQGALLAALTVHCVELCLFGCVLAQQTRLNFVSLINPDPCF